MDAPPPKAPLSPLRTLQDLLAGAFGISPDDRQATVATMLARGAKQSPYWLQAVLSMGIATLGLALGSTAVVIGAMLISPLMGPLVELGMGLAIGSPLLVMRSAYKTGLSVLVVILGAAVITLALPFHEITGEISSRIAPTVLDLGVATFCAFAAVYSVARPGSDTTATAAGTAIGIALVPPLCVVGYGIGTRSARIAGGAGLLFTANLFAILVVAVGCFLALGYSSVPVRDLERGELARPGVSGLTAGVARRLDRFFASKYGPVSRIAMPLLLLVAVYVPLRTALGEVTWEVRVRSAIQSMLGEVPQRSVESVVQVGQHDVEVRVVLIGAEKDAIGLRESLAQRIETVAGVKPTVTVIAVPDAQSLRRLEASLSERQPEVPPATADLTQERAAIGAALEASWPKQTAGPLLAWRVVFSASAQPSVEVVHVGAALGPPGETLLAKVLRDATKGELTVKDVPLRSEPVVADPAQGAKWLAQVQPMVDAMEGVPDLLLCVHVPSAASARDAGTDLDLLRGTRPFREGRVILGNGALWEAFYSTTPCPTDGDAGVDAASDAGLASD